MSIALQLGSPTVVLFIVSISAIIRNTAFTFSRNNIYNIVNRDATLSRDNRSAGGSRNMLLFLRGQKRDRRKAEKKNKFFELLYSRGIV